MFDFSARSFLILLSMTLIVALGDRTAQAQSLPQTGTNAEQTQPRRLRQHIGVGGSIGVSGEDTGLSEGGFAMMTRTDLNDRLSIRGTTVFGNTRSDNAIALTVNLPVRSRSGQVLLIPFVGGGALISSKSLFNDVIVRGLVTGGIDVPLSDRFTATTSVNVGFTDTTSVGVRLGVMYGF